MSFHEHGARGARATDAVLVTCGALALVVARLLSPDRVAHGPVLCPFRLLTGVPCPSCGLTRSWVDLAHGHLETALGQHPFGPASMVFVAVATLVGAAHLVTGRWVVRPRLLRVMLVVLAAATGVFGVLRWVMLGTGA